MEYHKIAGIFPMMDPAEFSHLKTDIMENGFDSTFPILLYEGQILDGRNRYEACCELGTKPVYKDWRGDSAISFVIRSNLNRRNLNSSQRAVVANEALKFYKEEAKARQKLSKGQGVKVVKKLPTLNHNKGKATERAARDFKTNRQYVSDVKEIIKKAPKKVEEIKTGKKTISQVKREIKKEELKEKIPELPTDKFRVIYADPPWKYGNSNQQNYGHASYHYPQMSISELSLLKIKEMIEDNAVLFLWVTSPLLAECWPVIKAWGFKYKASFVWDKVGHNFGHYNSVRHEFLLICTRGSCLPENGKLHDSVVEIKKSRKHSEKPEYFRRLIDELYPMGKAVELFSRKKTLPGRWVAWGNEA